jgi:hypothetical protein
LDLLIAYDSTEARERALILCNHLAQELTQDYDLTCAWCSFDQLQDASEKDGATRAAANAQMIIMSLRDGRQLPPLVQDWMNQWLQLKTKQCSALVALLGRPRVETAAPSFAQAYLEQAAGIAQMDFFCHSYEVQRRDVPVSRVPAKAVRTAITEDLLPTPVPFSRWGINE